MDKQSNYNQLNKNQSNKKQKFLRLFVGVVVLFLLYFFYDFSEFDSNSSNQNSNGINNGIVDHDSSYGDVPEYRFRSERLLNDHYEKHGIEMGFADAESYEWAASKVVENENALHKLEAEDGDDVYYIEETNEFVIVSRDGYIRTYFNPSDGLDYFNRQ